MNTSFGKYIKELRTSSRLTQQQLADAIGVSKSYISLIENDVSPSTTGPPRVSEEKLLKLASVLKVPADTMFNHAGRAPKGFKVVPVSEEKRARLRAFGNALQDQRHRYVDPARSTHPGAANLSAEDRDEFSSLEHVAQMIGISPERLTEIENGPTNEDVDFVEPSLSLLDNISAELDWHIDEIRRILGYDPDNEVEDRLSPDEVMVVETYRNRDQKDKVILLSESYSPATAMVESKHWEEVQATTKQERSSTAQEKYYTETFNEPSRFKLDARHADFVDPKSAGYAEAKRAWYSFGLPSFLPSLSGINRTLKQRVINNYIDALLTGNEVIRYLDDRYRIMFEVCLDYGYAYHALMSLDYSLPDLKRAEPDMVGYVQHLFRQLNRMQRQYGTILFGWDEFCCQERYRYPSLKELIGLLLTDYKAFEERADEISKMGRLSHQEKESRKAAFKAWREELAPEDPFKAETIEDPFFRTNDHWTALAQLEKSLEDPEPEVSCLAFMYLGSYAMIFAADREEKLSTGLKQLELSYPSLSYVTMALEAWYRSKA